jgi:dihydropteroate synthase
MITRVRRYRTPEEAAGEWARLRLDLPPAALDRVPEGTVIFLEGGREEIAAAASEAIELGLLSAASITGHHPRLCVVGGVDELEVLGAVIEQPVQPALEAYRSDGAPEIALKEGKLSFDRPLVMGILNATPDSFSDGGSYFGTDEAVLRALIMVEEGADIIDIGGESTRPGAGPVSAEEEMRRIVPAIRLIAMQTDVPISVDTRKAEVAAAAIEAGARMVNDVSGLGDDRMAKVVAENCVPLVLMHMLADPTIMQKEVTESTYDDVVSDVMWFWEERMAAAERAGVDRSRIILDPGIGFGKLPSHNLELLDRQRELRCAGRPLLIGASRKAFIGTITGRPPQERLGGSLGAAAVAAMNGASIVRVHDVKETVSLVRTVEAIKKRATG